MHLKLVTLKRSINKAYLKEKVSRTDIEIFKARFADLLNKIDSKGDEEHLKSLVAEFLRATWYKDAYQINPIAKNDLVIHTGKSPADPIAVLIEVKRPGNTIEMISENKPNAKALHELILYYLHERIVNNRHELKQLIATDIFKWYIFDANEFDKKIYRNTAIKRLYEQKRQDGKDNPWFYAELGNILRDTELSLDATVFDLKDFKKPALNANNDDDNKLIPLFKILSPVHLLKLSFANDSNTLQPKFYSELLHIIGLYEYKEGSKKLIGRKKDGERNGGSLLENAIINLDSHDKISRLDKPSQYGETYNERLYNVALELVITWVNRILFLKLLEAQLLNYHKRDLSYTFLNKDKINDYDDLDKLFFRVLAKKVEERSNDIMKLFGRVPYLNSSLFEPTELEHQTLFINGLEDNVALPILSSTVLKDQRGKTRKGTLAALDYLFDFLNAYDFSSEGAEEIQEDNKALINASVLGLIFEKINGYKDGSFFTPGFITMYMCRETIRRSVVQKFNESKGWDLKEYSELYDCIKDKKEANQIINSLKICDPAVGSGHFLVSALNEIIAIKSDLDILMGADGRTLRDHHIEVVNDELIVTDDDGDPFTYNYKDLRSQMVQQTLFHEKQTIIENCLFGVDINPNSVKICRLRLWIELLKNAYYKPATSGEAQLETLPNIDINIKTGNSLISRFALDADLKQALRNTKWNINDYRIAVGAYKNATNKDEKKELSTLIDSIKNNFRTTISRSSKEYIERSKLRSQLEVLLSTNQDLFGTKKNKKQLELEQRRLELSIQKQDEIIEEVKSNKIFENAFEWRFEFPEVLNDNGEFLGFDIIIGNPPYGVQFSSTASLFYSSKYSCIDDIYTLFIERASGIVKNTGYASFIIPIFWLTGDNYYSTRKFIYKNTKVHLGIVLPYNIFIDAFVDTGIFIFSKIDNWKKTLVYEFPVKEKIDFNSLNFINFKLLEEEDWGSTAHLKMIYNNTTRSLVDKIGRFPNTIGSLTQSIRGILAEENDYSSTKIDEDYKPVFVGKLDRYSIDEKKIAYVKYGKNLKEQPSNYNYFLDERILVRRIVSRKFRVMATIAEVEFVVKKDIYLFKLNHTSTSFTKYLLAIINSKLISYLKTKGSVSAKKNDFTQITLSDLRNISVPIPTDDNLKLINKLVVDILNLYKVGKDTRNLDNELDVLIYQLYELTQDEIKIVEGEIQ